MKAGMAPQKKKSFFWGGGQNSRLLLTGVDKDFLWQCYKDEALEQLQKGLPGNNLLRTQNERWGLGNDQILQKFF